MQKSDHHEQNLTSPRGLIHKILRRTNSRRSPTAAEQQTSPVSPETSNTIFSKQKDPDDVINDPEKASTHSIRIEDEKSDLLGCEVYSGKLTLETELKVYQVNSLDQGLVAIALMLGSALKPLYGVLTSLSLRTLYL